jgi:hypothetical protein
MNSPRRSSLESTSTVYVRQGSDWSEVIPLVEERNRYVVKNSSGETLLSIGDTSHGSKNFLLRKVPPFRLHASTAKENMLVEYHIPFRWFRREVYVTDRADKLLGKVRQRFASIRNTFLLYNDTGQELCQVVGQDFYNLNYVISRNGVNIGSLSKIFGGLAREILTDADTYCMKFPQDIDVRHKYLLLGVLLLIDLTYRERS